MKAFIITFDLVGEDKTYDEINEQIESYTYHKKVAESSYIIATNKVYNTIVDELRDCTDNDDNLFIGEIVDKVYNQYGGETEEFMIESEIVNINNKLKNRFQ